MKNIKVTKSGYATVARIVKILGSTLTGHDHVELIRPRNDLIGVEDLVFFENSPNYDEALLEMELGNSAMTRTVL